MEQVSNLREVQAIQRLSPHQQIVKLIEVILCVFVFKQTILVKSQLDRFFWFSS